MSTPGRFEDKDFQRIELTCATCGDACIRSLVDCQWVHVEDYVHLTGIYAGDTSYDHTPRFDVIEVSEAGKSATPKRDAPKPPGDPFNKIEFPRQKRR